MTKVKCTNKTEPNGTTTGPRVQVPHYNNIMKINHWFLCNETKKQTNQSQILCHSMWGIYK